MLCGSGEPENRGTLAGVALTMRAVFVALGISETSGDPGHCGPACSLAPVVWPDVLAPLCAKGALQAAYDWARPLFCSEILQSALSFDATTSSS